MPNLRVSLALLTGGLLCLTTVRADAPPSPEQILERVRLTQSQQQLDLTGQLRSGASVIPFRITQTGPVILYTFATPPVVLHLTLGADRPRVDVVRLSRAASSSPIAPPTDS